MKKLMMMVFAMISIVAFGAEYEWSETAAGTFDWNDSLNWGSAGYPNASGDVTTLTNSIGGAQVIDLNQTTTIGSMKIGSPDSATFTIAGPATGVVGGNTLVFTNDSGDTTITGFGTATDIINADVEFGSDTTIDTPGKAIEFNGVTTSTNKNFVITDNSDVYFQNLSNDFTDCEITLGTNATIYSQHAYYGEAVNASQRDGAWSTIKNAKIYMDNHSEIAFKGLTAKYQTLASQADVVALSSNVTFSAARLSGISDSIGYYSINSFVGTNTSIFFTGSDSQNAQLLNTYLYGTNYLGSNRGSLNYLPMAYNLRGTGKVIMNNGSYVRFDSDNGFSDPYTGTFHVENGAIGILARDKVSPLGFCDVYLGKDGGSGFANIICRNNYHANGTTFPNDIYIVGGYLGTVTIGGTAGGTATFTGTINASNDFSLIGSENRPLLMNGAIKGKCDISVSVDYRSKYSSSSISFGGSTTNTFDGTVSVNRGRFVLNKTGDGITAIPGDIIVGDGAGVVGAEDQLLQTSSEQIADTSTMTVNSYGKYDVNGNTETISNLWVNGSAIVVTSGGRLALGTDPGTGTNIVVNGGTLGGTGYINETINVQSGKLVPGYENAGTLTAGNIVTLATDAVCSFYISPSDNTVLVTADALTLGGTVEVTADPDFTPSLDTYYGVIKTDGTVSGSFNTINAGTINGVSMKVSTTGNITDTEVLPTGGDDVVLYAMPGGTMFIIQ